MRWPCSGTRSGLKVASCPSGAGRPMSCAPVAALSAAAAGEWSRWVCVQIIHLILFFPSDSKASMCEAMLGPGSITASASAPTRYELVPGPVMAPGFGAVRRVTRRSRRFGAPEEPLAILALGAAGAVRHDFRQGRCVFERQGRTIEPVEILQGVLGREDQLNLASRATLECLARPHPHVVHSLVLVVRAFLPLGC